MKLRGWLPKILPAQGGCAPVFGGVCASWYAPGTHHQSATTGSFESLRGVRRVCAVSYLGLLVDLAAGGWRHKTI